jgi:hypothetical protein
VTSNTDFDSLSSHKFSPLVLFNVVVLDLRINKWLIVCLPLLVTIVPAEHEEFRRLLCPISVLRLKPRKGTFIRIVWTIIWKVFETRLISMLIHSHLGTSETLRFNVRLISAAHNRRTESLN